MARAGMEEKITRLEEAVAALLREGVTDEDPARLTAWDKRLARLQGRLATLRAEISDRVRNHYARRYPGAYL